MNRTPDPLTALILREIIQLNRKVYAMSEDQDHLDTDVAALTVGLQAVEDEIAALKAVPAGTPLDFTALDAAVARITADIPPPVEPPVT